MSLQLGPVQQRAPGPGIFGDEQVEQLAQMAVQHVRLGAAQRAPDGLADMHLANAAPVNQSALQGPGRVAPEPGIVDVGVPVAQRDHLRPGKQEARYGVLLRDQPRRIGAKAFEKARVGQMRRHQMRILGDELRKAPRPIGKLPLVIVIPPGNDHLFDIKREVTIHRGAKPPRFVRARKQRQRGHQHTVMRNRLWQQLIHAFGMMRLYRALTEGNPLGDENAGTRGVVEIGIDALWHGNRKGWVA